MNMILQILLAFIIVIILYIITLVVLNIDALIVKVSGTVKPKETSIIMDGKSIISSVLTRTYNTYNQYSPSFIKIGKSVNMAGGAQFTYQFWINVTNAEDSLFEDLIILLKGDDRKFKAKLYSIDAPYGEAGKLDDDYYIACPLIKFGKSYRNMVVQFNTNNNPRVIIPIDMNPSNNVISRRNLLSLLPLNWYLLTFTFEDNFSFQNGAENGINFKFWVNDIPYQESGPTDYPILKGNTLKQNDGNLYMFPNINSRGSGMQIGNIKYYNYALRQGDISKVLSKGPPVHDVVFDGNTNKDPPYLSAFNKIDIMNY